MNEQWKEIKGNREIYEISNLGNVRTKDREGARGNIVKGHVFKYQHRCELICNYLKKKENSNA